MLKDSVLDEYRIGIDYIDKQLIGYLEKRFELCVNVGKRKKELGIEVVQDPDREEAIMAKLEKDETYKGMVRKLWPVIMEFSRSLQ